RRALHGVLHATPDRCVACAGDNRLTAGGRVEESIGRAAGDRLAGDAGNRLVTAVAAGNRVGHLAPDRLVAAVAADDRLAAAGAIDDLAGGAVAAENRIARRAADRLVEESATNECIALTA